MRISDGSLDVVSSELQAHAGGAVDRACVDQAAARGDRDDARLVQPAAIAGVDVGDVALAVGDEFAPVELRRADLEAQLCGQFDVSRDLRGQPRSEEHTSELQSLMRNSYAVFCLKTKKRHKHH